MTVKRGRKHSKKRGSRECGYGLTHRGRGNRGGAGNAGSGKKAKCKQPAKGLWRIQEFGKHGFNQKGVVSIDTPINLRDLEVKLDTWLVEKAVTKEGDVFVVDLPKLGYNKLLSSGKITNKLKINVPKASKVVVEKVKTAGGEVIGVKQ